MGCPADDVAGALWRHRLLPELLRLGHNSKSGGTGPTQRSRELRGGSVGAGFLLKKEVVAACRICGLPWP